MLYVLRLLKKGGSLLLYIRIFTRCKQYTWISASAASLISIQPSPHSVIFPPSVCSGSILTFSPSHILVNTFYPFISSTITSINFHSTSIAISITLYILFLYILFICPYHFILDFIILSNTVCCTSWYQIISFRILFIFIILTLLHKNVILHLSLAGFAEAVVQKLDWGSEKWEHRGWNYWRKHI